MSTDNEIEDVQGAQENVVNSAVKEKIDRKITSVSLHLMHQKAKAAHLIGLILIRRIPWCLT